MNSRAGQVRWAWGAWGTRMAPSLVCGRTGMIATLELESQPWQPAGAPVEAVHPLSGLGLSWPVVICHWVQLGS